MANFYRSAVVCLVTHLVVTLLFARIPTCLAQTTSANTDRATTTNTVTSGAQNTTPSYTEVNGSQVSFASNCVLDVDPVVVDQFQDVLLEGASLVYFKLNFDGVEKIYDNSSNVVDPNTWVWAIEGKGHLLLTYPFDFQQLSLGTLSPGVKSFSLDVELPSNGCFQGASDSDKQRIIASYISAIARAANSSVNSDVYEGKDFMVCSEKQLNGEEFDLIGVYGIPLCTYYVFQGSTVFDCWLGSENAAESEPSRVSKHGWLGAIFALGFIMALFSPLASSFFVRKNPPPTIDGTEYVALNSDLPLGLKYLLLYSYHECSVVVAIRWFIYVVAFMMIPFIPFIVSYSIHGEDFTNRIDVAFELLLSKGLVVLWFIVINLLFLAIAMFILGLYLFESDFVPKNLKVQPADRRYFGFAFDLKNDDPSKDYRVPESTGPPIRGFISTMWYRTQMAINPDIWHFWFSPIWERVYGLLGGRNEGPYHGWRLCITLIVFLVVFPFALFVFLFLLLLNSVPLIYTLAWTISKCLSNKIKPAEVVVAVMTMFLSFAVLFIFVAAFVYIAEILGYTFIGFVLNSDFAGPILVVILTFAGYLTSAATGFYDKYCNLLKTLIEKAEEVDKANEKKAVATRGEQNQTPTADTDNTAPHTSDPDATAIPLGTRGAADQQPMLNPVRTLVHSENGTPMIPLKLYRAAIAKYHPMHLEVASICLELVIVAIIVAFGLATIIFIDSVSDIPAVVEFFATVVVATVVPIMTSILKSPARQECEDETKSRKLEVDLEYYIECEPGHEHFQTVTL